MYLLAEGAAGGHTIDTTVSLAQWAILVGFVLGALAIDRFVLNRKPRELTLRQSALQTAFFVGLSLAFGAVVILPAYGGEGLVQYYGLYVAEYSLSIDNLFILMIILKTCGIPKHLHQKALYWGINIAIILRTLLIVFGTTVLVKIDWVMLGVAAYMIYVGITQVTQGDDETDITEGRFYRLLTRFMPVTVRTYGDKMFIRRSGSGRRIATLLLLAIILIGYIDLVFALDSIPTAIALSSIMYVTVAGNINGVLGLRPVYFLMGHVTKYIRRLNWGLALICCGVGVKLILGNPTLSDFLGYHPVHVPIAISLSFIGGSLLFGYVAGKLWPPKHAVDVEDVVTQKSTMVAVYMDCGPVMDGEWRTGLMHTYLTQVLAQARHYDSDGTVPLYGYGRHIEEYHTVALNAEEPDLPARRTLGNASDLAAVLRHAKEAGESVLGTHVAIVMTAGVTADEDAARQALREMPENTFVVFVRVSDEPGGAELLQELDDLLDGEHDRCNTVHATDDHGRPKHHLEHEIGEELDNWLHKRGALLTPA